MLIMKSITIRRKISTIFEIIKCDDCGYPLFKSNGFYTCFNCGLISNERDIRPSTHYKENSTQHAILDKNYPVTNLGNQNEILTNENIKPLAKMQKWIDNEKNSLNKVKSYISSILGKTHIKNKNLEEDILNK